MLKKSSTVFSSRLSFFLLILTFLMGGLGAQATEVRNNKSSGYLLCVNSATKVVTFPGKSVCPKGSKKLVLGAQGVAGTDGLPGAAGLPGKDGTNGKDGKTLWNGKVDPVSALGSPGDMFINTFTNTLFGPKSVESGWPIGVSLVGPKGERGPAGPAVSHEEISDLVTKARGHLTQMTLTRNTPAYHDHHESFNLVHAQLEKKAPAAHQILGIMRHLTVNPNPQSADHFELADKALGDTLSAYKAKSTHNVAASRAGRAERIRRIKAERAGTTE